MTKSILPKEHIQQIRKNKFWLGINDTQQKNPLADDLHSATEQLSEGLYSKNIHFILELIQNAEDNTYPPNTQPKLIFILSDNASILPNSTSSTLVIVNNEMGFRKEHVEALCAVGKSTKVKENRAGYIGEKGIGFKSVFQVSSQPHIYSAGYQFYFSEQPDPEIDIGFIVPYWCDETPNIPEDYLKSTCIVLPLKKNKQSLVRKQLLSIAPETILFLSKLEHLIIKSDTKNIKISRDNSRKPLVKLSTNSNESLFWVTDAEYNVPNTVREEKRANVRTRIVTIACPLSSDYLPENNVFAFLPTEMNSGLPFLINADFILSAGRERIQMDRDWNRWLRDCVAPTFEIAFTTLLTNDKYRFIPYKYLPKEDIRNPFFNKIALQIKNILTTKKIVWTYDEKLLAPAYTRFANKAIRDLFLLDDVPQQIRKTPLIHPKITQYKKELRWIGVTNISQNEILACLNDREWLQNRSSEWFVSLFRYLNNQDWVTKDKLADIALLPIQGEPRKFNHNHQKTYFPVEDIEPVLQTINDLDIGLTIDFLESSLYKQIEDDRDLQHWLTTTLGVKTPTIENLCIDLVETLVAQQILAGEKDILSRDLIRVTSFIRDQFANFSDSTKDTIRKNLPLLLDNDKVIFSGECYEIAMPKTMDPETGWQIVFDEYPPNDICILSDKYLQESEPEEKEHWYQFFREIGATACPTPKRKTTEVDEWWHDCEEFSDYEKTYLQENYERSTQGAKLFHYVPPDWLWNGYDISMQKAKALVKWLEKCFELNKTGWSWGQYKYFFRYERTKDFDSEFVHYLKIIPWFPSTQGFKCPGEIFLDKPELREIFGDKLPYAKIKPSPEVAKFLGIHSQATTNEMLRYLTELAEHPATEIDKELIVKIYSFFANRSESSHLLHVIFQNIPLLLLSKPKPVWINAKQAIFPDLSAVFGDTYYYLEGEYPEKIKDFFVKTLDIPNNLDTQLYAKALLQMAKQSNKQPISVRHALEQIYPELLKVAKSTEKPDWWEDFCRKVAVWTQREKFIFPAHTNVYIPDDQDLKKRFASKANFVWRPEKASFNDYLPLYQAWGVKSLVAGISLVADVEEILDLDAFEPILTDERIRAICIYLYNEENERYHKLKDEGILEKFIRTQEIPVSKLVVNFRLDGTTLQDSDSVVFWDKEANKLYRKLSKVDNTLVIEYPVWLARQLTGGRQYRGLENWVGRILNVSYEQIEGIIEKHNWSFPDDEDKWFKSIKPLVPTNKEYHSEQNENTDTSVMKQKQTTGGNRDGVPKGVQGKSRSRTHKGGSMAVTYVIPHGKGTKSKVANPDSKWERSKIEQMGVDIVLAYETRHGRKAEDMNNNHVNNPGYDIKSYEDDGNIRFIEVKTKKDAWSSGFPVHFTKRQFSEAKKRGKQFWLYVVENVLDSPKVYPINDPVNRIDRYLFDSGWRNLSEIENTDTLKTSFGD